MLIRVKVMSRKHILAASANQALIESVRACLEKDFKVDVATDRRTSLEMFRRKRYEFTFLDIGFLKDEANAAGRPNFKEALLPFWQAFPSADIIVLSPPSGIREAVAAVKAGASNYLTYPLDPHEVCFVTESLGEMHKIESELLHLRDTAWRSDVETGLRTRSPKMMEVLEKVMSVAPTKTSVLLTGETGTGKGVMARLIHAHSNRADKPFIAVHCGAIPDTLLESELFGHEKGAFTGAIRRKMGKFQIADGGTIFLDEAGTISAAAQIKLLQVLQEKTLTRVGGEASTEVDVRIVAATNMDLGRLAEERVFRKDLFYRLNVFPIVLPPLRERPEDIALLAEDFVEKFNRTYNKDIRGLDPEVIEALVRYPWPGNIRELENLVERAYILEKEPILTSHGFPVELFTMETLTGPARPDNVTPLAEVRQKAVEQAEKRYLRDLLTMNKGRIDKSAALAGVTPRQLRNLLVKHGLHKEDFR